MTARVVTYQREIYRATKAREVPESVAGSEAGGISRNEPW